MGRWLPRLLFGLTTGAAGALIALVILSPLLDNGAARPDGWPRVLAVFARDAVLRRITVAAALGLTVTALIFFRPATSAPPPSKPKSRRRTPPSPIADA